MPILNYLIWNPLNILRDVILNNNNNNNNNDDDDDDK